MSLVELDPYDDAVFSAEHLAVVTYSSNIDPFSGEIHMSALTQFVADVALYGWGKENTKYVIAGERSFTDAYPSTGDLIETDFEKSKVPEQRIQVVNSMPSSQIDLNNTAEQVQALSELFTNDTPLVALALSYHLPRLRRYSNAYGLNMSIVAADKIWQSDRVQSQLDDESRKQHEKVLEALPVFAKRERLVTWLTCLDRKGLLLKLGNNLQGPCLHDIDESTGVPIISTTRKRALLLGLPSVP